MTTPGPMETGEAGTAAVLVGTPVFETVMGRTELPGEGIVTSFCGVRPRPKLNDQSRTNAGVAEPLGLLSRPSSDQVPLTPLTPNLPISFARKLASVP